MLNFLLVFPALVVQRISVKLIVRFKLGYPNTNVILFNNTSVVNKCLHFHIFAWFGIRTALQKNWKFNFNRDVGKPFQKNFGGSDLLVCDWFTYTVQFSMNLTSFRSLVSVHSLFTMDVSPLGFYEIELIVYSLCPSSSWKRPLQLGAKRQIFFFVL